MTMTFSKRKTFDGANPHRSGGWMFAAVALVYLAFAIDFASIGMSAPHYDFVERITDSPLAYAIGLFTMLCLVASASAALILRKHPSSPVVATVLTMCTVATAVVLASGWGLLCVPLAACAALVAVQAAGRRQTA